MTETFKENTRSFCSRIRADLDQIKYCTDLLTVNPDSSSKNVYLVSMEEYMSKIQDHINSIRKLYEG